jgi:hypothetical protein
MADGREAQQHNLAPEAHGGRLSATPNEPHGAVFYVMLLIGEKIA